MVDILEEFGEPRDASDWLIALREQPDDPVLQQKFDAWLMSSPENVTAWQEVNDIGALFRNLDAGPSIQDRAAPAPGAIAVQHPKSPRHPGMARHSGIARHPGPAMARIGHLARSHRVAMAAGSLMLVLLVVMLTGMPGTGSGDFYETATAQTRTITLADQSRIDLAPDSRVEVAYEDDVRQVILRDGTAFFDVTPNKQRPFVVKANGLSVRVLGTAFEVRTDNTRDEVSVAEGLVEVTGADGSTQVKLAVGDHVVARPGADWTQDKVQLESISAWRRGLIVARNERLGDLVDDISDYYQGYVIMPDDSLKDMEISGVFDVTHPERALDIIGQSHGLEVRAVTPWIRILSKK
ncbi:FecR family protein [Thalassospira povalilytica]|uniref:FecR domain-containing protein n=1 Tax=Thalassospira povalilytica TaxID=732237 RepID=A0A8I1M9Y9_9PROT|nr:FecR domain-containing protein [Thalassospira povalilytica]MBN8197744.1 FecR domain-containing protein [Thalassospira povalilytica]